MNILKAKPLPKRDQETVITYDPDKKEWFIYTDYPPHARKYEALLMSASDYGVTKVYHEKTGELISIEGQVEGSGSLRARRQLSDVERERMTSHLRKPKVD